MSRLRCRSCKRSQVKKVSPAGSDPTFCNTVLPGTSIAGSLRLNPETLHGFDNFRTEVRSSVKDQISRRGIVRKRFAQLLNDPRAGGILGDIAMKNAPPVMCNHKEAVKHAEGERGTVKKSIAAIALR